MRRYEHKRLCQLMIVLMIIGLVLPLGTPTYANEDVKYQHKDDFNTFDDSFWTVLDRDGLAMHSVSVSEGVLTLNATKTDNYPTLISKGIPIEKGDKLVIKRRTYAHPEHTYFAPSTYITEEADASWNWDRDRSHHILLFFQHLYFTYDEGRYPENLTKGNFGYARLDNFTKPNELAPENYGITRSTLDEWVDEEFTYDTVTGDVTITSGGESMSFKGRPLEHDYVRFQMVPYGWYTGQYDQLDWIEFSVIGAGESSHVPSVQGQGLLKGLVQDASGKMPMQGVTVTLVKDEQAIETVRTDNNGEYSFSVAAGVYDLTLKKDGFIGAAYSSVESNSGETTYLETVLQVPQGTSNGQISGDILNAVTGHLEANVTVEVRDGINNREGAAVLVLTADQDGHYAFDGAPGYYTFIAKKQGFIDKVFSTSLQSGANPDLSDVAISPMLQADQIRVVLRWGSAPSDLDSHMTLSTTAGQLAHVDYNTQIYKEENMSMILDVDDQNGEGPETITLTKARTGTYSYSVHDYSNKELTSSNKLAASMATVEVYVGNSPAKVFHVPNQAGTLWKVFEYDGVTVRPINTMSYQGDSGMIQ